MAAPTQVGHGALGVSSHRRSYLDLAADPNAERLPRLALNPGKTLTGWTVHAGSVYKTTVSASDLELAGAVRAIVGLETGVGQRRATRVWRLADVAAGKWYYDEHAQTPGGSTDLYLQLSDSSNPTGTTVLALLSFQFGAVGEVVPVVGPEMSPDPGFENWTTTTNATDWTEENVGATGVAITQEAASVVEGSSAMRIAPGASGLAAGTNGGAYTGPHVLVAGREYLVSVAYWTAPELNLSLSARLRVRQSAAGNYLADDCDSETALAAGQALEPTGGEWARGLMVFRSPWDTTDARVSVRLFNAAGVAASGGYVIFDDFHLWPILRYEYVQPAIAASSIPDQEVMSADAIFGPKSMGVGAVSLLDGDGSLATALARLDLFHRPAMAFSAGRFQSGEEVARDDWRVIFPALLRRPRYEDGLVSLELEDARTLTRRKAASSSLRIADLSGLEPTDEGKAKPLLFGDDASPRMPANRVAIDANGYGAYEVLDPRVPVADGVNVGLPLGWHLKIYPNKELAELGEKGRKISEDITAISAANPTVVTTFRRHGLTTGDSVTLSGTNSTPSIDGTRTATVTGEFTYTVAVNVTVAGNVGQMVSHRDVDVVNNNTRFRVLRDVQNMQYDKTGEDQGTGCVFIFDTELSFAVGDKKVTLDLAGPPWLNAANLQAAMRTAIGGGDTITTVIYSESTHQFTVARSSAGKFINLYSTGVNAAKPLVDGKDGWPRLGYDGKDHAGSATTSWTAEKAIFVDAERDHVLRFPAGGYHDDASGTIGGVADQPIDNYPAVASWLLQKVLSQPAATVDVVGTFKAARLLCLSSDFTKLLWHVSSGEDDVFKILAICERGGVMNLVLEGRSDGGYVWRCKKYSSSIVGAVELTDRHYLDWETWSDPDLLFKEVRFYGDYRPDLKRSMTWAGAPVLDPVAMAVRHGADDRVLEVDAALERSQITSGLVVIPNYYGRLIGATPMIARTAVRGLLIARLPGDKVILWRSRAADPLGSLGMTAVAIVSSSVAGSTVITTSTPHWLKTGQLVRISGHSGSTPAIDGDHRVTVTGAKTFTINVNVTVGGTGGSFIRVPVFRIVGLRHDHSTGVSQVTAIDDVALT